MGAIDGASAVTTTWGRAVTGGNTNNSEVELIAVAELRFNGGKCGLCTCGPLADGLAGSVVNDNDGDIAQWFTLLDNNRRVGEG